MELDVHQKVCMDAIKSWTTQFGQAPFSCHALEKVSLEMRNKKNKNAFTTVTETMLKKGYLTQSSDGRQPYFVSDKQKAMLIEVIKETKTWIDDAQDAVKLYGHQWPGINWDLELKRCLSGKDRDSWMNWFRRARLPALLHDRFYLDGFNRKGAIKTTNPPLCGWEGTPVDVLN
jgi:hypothetical protein|tara:strand:- start:1045 stop:1566 length:522 start_codon:yes stop_codon:yes gene_type:complete